MHRSNRLMDIMDCRLEAMGPDGQFGAWPKRAWSGATVDDDEGRVPVFRDGDFRRRSKRRGKQGGMRAKRSPSAGLLGALVAEWDEAKKDETLLVSGLGTFDEDEQKARSRHSRLCNVGTTGHETTEPQKIALYWLGLPRVFCPPLQPVMDDGGDGRIAKPGYTEEF